MGNHARRRVTRRKTKRVVRKKARKPKKKSVVGTKLQVFRGTKLRTVGGLTKKDLTKNKRGKVVSIKQSKTSTKRAKQSGFLKWGKSLMQAKKNLGLTGFHKCPKGSKLYKECRKIYDSSK